MTALKWNIREKRKMDYDMKKIIIEDGKENWKELNKN